jgi:hypothetical protein
MIQGITVEYEKRQLQCLACRQKDISQGQMVYLDHCKHTFHICCLIDYGCLHGIQCPECKEKVEDIRLSLAVAYKKQDTLQFIHELLPDK